MESLPVNTSEARAMITQYTKYHGSISTLERGGWRREGGQGHFLEEIIHESNLESTEAGQMKKNEEERDNRRSKGMETDQRNSSFSAKRFKQAEGLLWDWSLPVYLLSFRAYGGQMSPHARAVPLAVGPRVVVIKS